MKITNTYNWSRRDFSFDAECEHCRHTVVKQCGYDDHFFYGQVIPSMVCANCGESSLSKTSAGVNILTPRYDKNLVM